MCWAQCRAWKQQEGAFLITLHKAHCFPDFCKPFFIFSPDGTSLNLLSWSTGDSHPSPLCSSWEQSPHVVAHPVTVRAGRGVHRELSFEVKLWHSYLARRHQVTDLAHGSVTYFPDGSWLWLTFPESVFLTLSYLPDSIKSPTVTLPNPSTVICPGQNNFLWGAIFHSSASYCCLTGSHLLLFCSKMSPVCGTAVLICLPSSHTLLFCLTLRWQPSRHYRILYLFIYFSAQRNAKIYK